MQMSLYIYLLMFNLLLYKGGSSVPSAFQSLVYCLSAFLCDSPSLDHVTSFITCPFSLRSHSLYSLLYSYLNEALFQFTGDQPVLISKVSIADLCYHIDCDDTTTPSVEWSITGSFSGEVFDRSKHGVGTEVKAITHSNMQIFVLGELMGENTTHTQIEKITTQSNTISAINKQMHGCDLYVIVDI